MAGGGGKDLVLVATEENQVYALNATSGAVVWQKKLGNNVATSSLPCGNINPLGITGTPVIDAASRTMFVDAMTSADGGTTKKHLIFAMSLDDGSTRAGWPLDVSTVKAGALAFDPAVQNQRAALLLLNGTLYVPYSGHYGDCGGYHGWVVGVPIANPTGAKGYATQCAGRRDLGCERALDRRHIHLRRHRQHVLGKHLGSRRGRAQAAAGAGVQRTERPTTSLRPIGSRSTTAIPISVAPTPF